MYVWFESEMVLITNVELHAEMVELGGEDEIYSIKHMTRKLEKRYGKPNIVCFTLHHSKIFERTRNAEATKCERLIQTAAKLIKNDIKIS